MRAQRRIAAEGSRVVVTYRNDRSRAEAQDWRVDKYSSSSSIPVLLPGDGVSRFGPCPIAAMSQEGA